MPAPGLLVLVPGLLVAFPGLLVLAPGLLVPVLDLLVLALGHLEPVPDLLFVAHVLLSRHNDVHLHGEMINQQDRKSDTTLNQQSLSYLILLFHVFSSHVLRNGVSTMITIFKFTLGNYAAQDLES